MSLLSLLASLFSDTEEEETPPEPLVFGAELKCAAGTEHSYLELVTDSIDINDLPQACVSDCIANVNISPFGICKSYICPCKNVIWLEKQWENPEPQNILVNGEEIITTKSTLICRECGKEIRAVTSGQDGMYAARVVWLLEVEEKYPGLLAILMDPKGSLYLNEGMYEVAIQFLEDCMERHGGELYIPSIYDEDNYEGTIIRATLERLLPDCDTRSFERFINGLENAGVLNNMDEVPGWDVHILNEAMIEMLRRDCKETAERIETNKFARWTEEHRSGMNLFADVMTRAAYLAVTLHFALAGSGIQGGTEPPKTDPPKTIPQQLTREGQTPVIGKMSDLNTPGNVVDGEFRIADYLPDMGNPQANWHQNSGILRSVMNEGVPIKDVSTFPMDNAGFLGAERNLLQSSGWTYFEGYWYPPK